MQAQQPDSPQEVDPDFYPGPDLEVDLGHDWFTAGSGPALPAVCQAAEPATDTLCDTGAGTPARRQLLIPVCVSIVVHLCLLILLRQLLIDTPPANNSSVIPPASIKISFRPRPTEAEPVIEPDAELVAEQQPAPEPAANVAQPGQAALSDEPSSSPTPLPATQSSAAGPPSPGPRLAAPALLDLREMIKSRTHDDETTRRYQNMTCDERQRRNDLIDCGEEDPNSQYNFAAAEQNATVEFFAGLNVPTGENGNQPTDRTGTDARTRASLEHMNGNLGANALIRSVMEQP